MKATIIKDTCIGCGACQAIASSVFEIGDDGLAEVIIDIVDKKDQEAVIDASESCPTGAIKVTYSTINN